VFRQQQPVQSSPIQSLIAAVVVVVVAILALNKLGDTLGRFTPATTKPTASVPSSITLNLGGSAWTCNLATGRAYNCAMRYANRPKH
jgi:hypothetical protein